MQREILLCAYNVLISPETRYLTNTTILPRDLWRAANCGEYAHRTRAKGRCKVQRKCNDITYTCTCSV